MTSSILATFMAPPPKPRFPPFNPRAMPVPSLGALDPGPGINSGYGLPGLPGGLPFGPYGQYGMPWGQGSLPFAGVPGIPIMGAPPSLAGIGAPLGTAASILGAIPGAGGWQHHHGGGASSSSPATQAAVQAAVQAAAAQPGATPATIQAAAQAAAQSTAATSSTTPSTTSTTGTQPTTSTSPTSSTTATSTTPTTTTPASTTTTGTTTTGTSTQTPASTSTTTSGGTIPGTTISLPPQSQQNTQLHQWNQRQQQFGTQQPTQTAAQQQLNQWNQQQSNLRNQWNQQQRFGGGFNRGGGGQTQFGGFNRSPLQQQQFGSTGGFGFGGTGGMSGAPGGAPGGAAPAAPAAPTSTATRTSRYAVARMARADRWYPESDAEMNLEQKSMLMSRGCQCSLHYDRPPVVMVYNFPFVHGANFQPHEQVFVRLKLVVYGDEFWENEPHIVHDSRWVTANEHGSFVSLFEVDASFKMAGLLEAHGTQSDKFARQRIEIE